MAKKIHLVIVDPQNDFCDLPASERPAPAGGGPLAPALPVTGAHSDLLRVASLIDQGGAGLTDISVTLDSHQHIDIGHPTFWEQGDGAAVSPFTIIGAADVRAGRYRPRRGDALAHVLSYLDELEKRGRYAHMVWPLHCEIGTWGHNVHGALRLAYNRWEERTLNVVNKLIKGTNPWTEHYSAIQAEVPDASDPATQLNTAFISELARADRVFITGEAGSHCVRATTEDLATYLPAASLAKLVLVVDCMSPVTGFEQPYQDFLSAMRARGIGVANSDEVLAELLANAAA
jgi:nicotinamidase/pyrazinamidase